MTAMHWDGGIRYARGTRLPGWPCCCSGDRAERIAAAKQQTARAEDVTCRGCLRLMAQDEREWLRAVATRPRAAGRDALAELRDCGQDGVCATPPGCLRHWEERNRELVRERDEARAELAASAERIAALEGLLREAIPIVRDVAVYGGSHDADWTRHALGVLAKIEAALAAKGK